MKQPKKLTLLQKKLLVKNGLDPSRYMLVSDIGSVIQVIPKSGDRDKIVRIEKTGPEPTKAIRAK